MVKTSNISKQGARTKAVSVEETYVPRKAILSALALCLALFLFTSVSALIDDNSKSGQYIAHQQNKNLQFSFSDNSQSICNVTTLNYPEGVRTINLTMSNTQGTFAVTINSKNFTSAGTYCFNLQCNTDTGSVCREVTSTGFTSTLGFYFVFIVIIIGIFALGAYTKNNYLMMLGSIAILFLGFFIIKFGIDPIKDVQTTYAIGMIVWAIGIICIYISLEEQLKVWDKPQ